jgi:hypothetical protein
MLKRTLPYLIILLLLVLTGIILLNHRSGTLQQEISDFIPPDMAAVDQIMISRKNQEIILSKKLNSWELKSYGETKSGVVEFFISGLQRLEIVSPASKADRGQIRQNLVRSGSMVSFYHHDKKLMAFYVGYDSLGVQGTYIMDVRQKIPYRIKLKGFAEMNMENFFSPKAETWRKTESAR